MSDSPVEQTGSPSTPTSRRNDETTLVVAVVSAVADAAGTDPLELPPLGDVIDPEALNDLVGSGGGSGLESVTFEYAGYTVWVTGDGDVRVTRSE